MLDLLLEPLFALRVPATHLFGECISQGRVFGQEDFGDELSRSNVVRRVRPASEQIAETACWIQSGIGGSESLRHHVQSCKVNCDDATELLFALPRAVVEISEVRRHACGRRR